MALSAEERAVYEARLAEAETALHSLSLGTMARIYVDQNGERVEFTSTNVNKLEAYILKLKTKLGKQTDISGPMRIFPL